MKVLITGFEPFGGETINPAFEAIKLLEDTIDGAIIIKKVIPTVFKKSIKILEELIDEIKPTIVICVGQAGGRTKISVERVAINISDGIIPDNDGYQPIDEVIYAGGADGYFTNLPIKRMVRLMNENDIPSEISNTAGTYVCNHIMYGLMHIINIKHPTIKGGFIHVPFMNNQVIKKKNIASMNINDISAGIKYGIIGAINMEKDDKIIGGDLF